MFCTIMLFPDGTPFGQVTKAPVKIEKRGRAQVIVRVLGFPMGQVGFYTVRCWIEENEKIVSTPIEFKVEFEIIKQEKVNDAPKTNQDTP
jgi:hypothetical protein